MSDSVCSQFEAALKISKTKTEISWTSPIFEFDVERRNIDDENGQWDVIGSVPSDRTELSMESSLGEISKYEYRVVAKLNGISLESDAIDSLSLEEMVESNAENLATTIPSAPSAPSIAQRISDSKIVISWKPPSNDGCFPITSYIVERSNKHRTVWTPIDHIPGSETSASIDFKITHPAFRIVAENALGRSQPSEHLVIRQLMPAPPKVEIDASNSKYIEVKWSTVPSNESLQYAEAVCFHIWKRVGSETKSKFVKVAKDVKANSYRDTDVRTGQGYQYQVYSVSSSGKMKDTWTEWVKYEPMQEGAMDQSSGVLTPKKKSSSKSKMEKEVLGATVPSPPNGPPTIERVLEQSVRISWTPPSNAGNRAITSYIIECSTNTSKSWSSIKRVSGAFTSARVCLRDAYQEFRIIAENAVGRSKPSESAGIRRLRPEAPDVEVDTYQNYLKISWTVSDQQFPEYAEADSFRIRRCMQDVDGGQSKRELVAKDLMRFSFDDFRVVPGRYYQYEVTSVSVDGQTERSKSRWVKFEPGQEPIVEDNSNISMKTTKKKKKKSMVKNPVVLVEPKKEDQQREQAAVLVALVTGFLSNSNASMRNVPLGATVPAPPSGPPTIQRLSGQSIRISWTPSSNSGNCWITSYIIEYLSTSNEWWTPVMRISGSNTAAWFNLSMDEHQAFRIIAENAVGRSIPSQFAAIRQAPPLLPQPAPQTKGFTSSIIDKSQITLAKKAKVKNPVVPSKDKAMLESKLVKDVPSAPILPAQVASTLKLRPLVKVETQPNSIMVTWTVSDPQYPRVEFRIPPEAIDRAEFRIRKSMKVGRGSQTKFVSLPMDAKAKSYRDTDVVPGQMYQYEVSMIGCSRKNKSTTSEWVKFELMQEPMVKECTSKSQSNISAKMSVDNSKVKNPVMLVPPPEMLDKDVPSGVTVPAPPNGPLKTQRLSEQSISVSWEPPSNNGNSPITSYIIECSTNTNKSWSAVKQVPGNCTLTAVDLKCVRQVFRVIAENVAGRSEPLKSAKIRQLVPAPPRVKVEAQSNCIEIKCSVPEHSFPKYAKAVSFRIRKSTKLSHGGQTKLVNLQNDVKANSYRDTDVVPGQMYRYQVSSIGCSRKSKSTKTDWVKFGLAQEPMAKESTSKSQSNISAGTSAQSKNVAG